jgi:hypothetical protein
MSAASKKQITRLQTLYSLYAKGAIGEWSREARLVWASANIGRSIASFNDLKSNEAAALTDVLQASLGQPPTRPRRDRDRARAAGTEGRRGRRSTSVTLASAEDITAIGRYLQTLGWDQARLEAFLRSKASPTSGRTTIRTLADSNRVRWALKRMCERAAKVAC